MILDEIAAEPLQARMENPNSIDWDAVQAAYAPRARIVESYIPPRMRHTYPIVASPDIRR